MKPYHTDAHKMIKEKKIEFPTTLLFFFAIDAETGQRKIDFCESNKNKQGKLLYATARLAGYELRETNRYTLTEPLAQVPVHNAAAVYMMCEMLARLWCQKVPFIMPQKDDMMKQLENIEFPQTTVYALHKEDGKMYMALHFDEDWPKSIMLAGTGQSLPLSKLTKWWLTPTEKSFYFPLDVCCMVSRENAVRHALRIADFWADVLSG